MTDGTILLIEDTPSLQLVYETVLRGAGYTVHTEGTAAAGHAAFQRLKPGVVLLDLMLPDRDGLDLMQDMLAQRPDANVIVITANGSINKAVAAMRAGAHEFLVKPFDDQRFLNAVENARASHRAGAPRVALDRSALPLGDFIGTSEPMQRVYAKIRSVARSMAMCSSPAKAAPARSCARRPCMICRTVPGGRSSHLTAARYPPICWSPRCSVI